MPPPPQVSVSSLGRERHLALTSYKATSDNKSPGYYIGPYGGKYSSSKQNRPKYAM